MANEVRGVVANGKMQKGEVLRSVVCSDRLLTTRLEAPTDR